jgi:hypothetical protein
LHLENLVLCGDNVFGDSLDEEMMNELFGFQNIRTLDLHINHETPGPMRRLKEVILSLKKLDVLKIRPGRDIHTGKLDSDVNSVHFDLGVQPGDKLPALSFLTLDSCIIQSDDDDDDDDDEEQEDEEEDEKGPKIPESFVSRLRRRESFFSAKP